MIETDFYEYLGIPQGTHVQVIDLKDTRPSEFLKRRLAAKELKILRRTSGVTRVDHARNENIRDRYGVAPIVEKLRKSRHRL